ncbi:MAG: metallophosphatase domain-containing protein [Proteobacteria bacterium]|nr:metallophosphatase domain-containing protein [Pseudomonadota bacterium]
MTVNATIVCISDTHLQHRNIEMPPGDILVHAGDWTMFGKNIADALEFIHWLDELPYAHKIVISGNHELLMLNSAHRREVLDRFILAKIIYLEDQGISIDGINFWGTPWQPSYGNLAFNLNDELERAEKWDLIPESTHVLIVHGPPHGLRDCIPDDSGRHAGCSALTGKISKLPSLSAVICGHIHEGAGVETSDTGVLVVNASICGQGRQAENKPTVIKVTSGPQGKLLAKVGHP